MAEKMDVLVCANTLEIGGAERALIGLLTELSEQGHNVDLFLCQHKGELMKYVPESVNILPEDKSASCLAIPFKKALKKGAFFTLACRLFAKMIAATHNKRVKVGNSNVAVEYSHLFTYRLIKKIKKEYDVVIGFHEPHYIAAYCTKAKIKIAWMHTDYKTIHVDKKKGEKVWNQFDKIVAISEDCKCRFLEVYPTLSPKVVVFENLIPKQLILHQADLFSVESEMPKHAGFNILSIGRFCYAKNFDNVPDICRRILALGANIRWYIIGFGSDEDLIKTKIKEAGMEERVILLGKKENPYPYIKACDLYVQPSRYEGKAITVQEAQLLGKPVAITEYPTSASQIQNGVDGIIIPLDNQGCAEGIYSVLKNR